MKNIGKKGKIEVGALMARGILKEIFKDKWEEFISLNKVRPVVIKEVEKMVNCRELNQGYTEYHCPECGEKKFVAFTCKSRLCTSCGKIATEEWIEEVAKEMLEVPHRHIVFTIPEGMRNIFLKDRDLLKILSDSAAETIQSYFWERSKKQKPTPGIICVIHTFGRDLKWNPHVHALVTEGVLRKDKTWKEIKYFHYEMLRKRWQHVLLKNIKKKYKDDVQIKKMINHYYKTNEQGFYVHAKNRMRSARGVAKYIGRYVSRPAIAESRIVKYDGENVTFWYERHENSEKVEVTLPVLEFIGKVVRHVPERYFKMVRYYGIYSRKNKRKVQKVMSIWKKFKQVENKRIYWRQRIFKAFGIDPLQCTKCGQEMQVYDIVYPKYGSMLEIVRRRMMLAYEKEKTKLLEDQGRSLSMYRLR